MEIIIINGPNLNLLGKREPEIYGEDSFEDFLLHLRGLFPEVSLHYFQSNSEWDSAMMVSSSMLVPIRIPQLLWPTPLQELTPRLLRYISLMCTHARRSAIILTYRHIARE